MHFDRSARPPNNRPLARYLLIVIALIVVGCAGTSEITEAQATAVPDPAAATTVPTQDTALDPLAFTTSFGSCLGYCTQVLTFLADTAKLSTQSSEDPTIENTGRLAPDTFAKLSDALSKVRVSELAATYGCPDCADGGASTIGLGIEPYVYEFLNPPREFADLDSVLMSLREALSSCDSSARITIASGCETTS